MTAAATLDTRCAQAWDVLGTVLDLTGRPPRSLTQALASRLSLQPR